MVLCNEMAQKLGAPARVHSYRPLHDVRLVLRFGQYLDADRITQQLLRESLHRRGESGREKQVLTLQ